MNINILCLLLFPPFFLASQTVSYKIYSTENKQEISLEDLAAAVVETDVLVFGEQHDDSLAHALQDKIYAMLLDQYGTVTLSMEMFETDGQLILDEYLAGHITESKMTNDTRAWGNYQTDYRSMVELAKKKKQVVIAANAPRRYVNMVSRLGLASLGNLSKDSKKLIAKLPIDTKDEGYYKRFKEIMGGHMSSIGMNIYHAQCVWDATMADRIYQHWKKHKKERIFHLTGRFHSDYQQGTITQLRRLNKKIRVKNISCFPIPDFEQPNWDNYADLGDFLIVSQEKIEVPTP
ncbi:MAG: ChaN family lipoprotein [Bacteroidota bacterium]